MNCPFNKIETKMNDRDFINDIFESDNYSSEYESKSNYRTPSIYESPSLSELNYNTNFTPLENGKKSCPCSDKNVKEDPNSLKQRFLHLFKATEGKSRAVSMYELLLLYVLFPILMISTQNTFLVFIWVGLMLKFVPEFILKEGVSKLDSMKGIAKRPGGVNCNMFNEGGEAKTSGIVSGNVFAISALTWFVLFKITEGFTETPNTKKILLFVCLLVWTLIVMNARHSLKCHTLFQVTFGLIIGFVWGGIMYYIYRNMRAKSKKLEEDEEKIMKLFE
jgi:hypothetical protein